MRYTTITDAIEQAVIPALGEFGADYDAEAIAREAFSYRVDTDERGNELLNTAGFEQVVDDAGFWVIAEKHATRNEDESGDDEDGCQGHESLNGADMGATVYCDGSCV